MNTPSSVESSVRTATTIIALSVALLAQSAPAPQVQAYVAWGNGIGKSGIVASSALGTPEVYLGGSLSTFGSNDYFYAVSYDATTARYVQTWVSGVLGSIRRIALGDVMPYTGNEIVVALSNGTLIIYDQTTKALRGQFSTAASNLQGLHLADIDLDSQDEILVTTNNDLYVYDHLGSLVWHVPGAGGNDVIVGQMDADASLEIATADGNVLDVASQTIQCTWPAGFGFTLEVSDIDGDGMEELVASEAWNFCWAYDIDTCLPKWSLSVFNVGAIRIGDGNGNGVPELIIGEAQWGNITGYDLVTLAPIWSINNPEHGTTDVAVLDVDQDGTTEVLWGAGATSTGSDRLYVGNPLTQSIEWENIQLDGPFIGPEIGHIDNDLVEEIVAVSWSSDSGYGAGRIVVIDPLTFQEEAVSQEVANGLGWTGVHDIKLRDVDGDGLQEILIATGTTYDALIEIYDYDGAGNFTKIWNNPVLPQGVTFYSVDAADVDNDGSLEIIGGTGAESTGSSGTKIYVYDYTTAATKWQSLQMGPFWAAVTDIEIADLDNDGNPEISGMVNGGDCYVFDGVTHALETIRFGTHESQQLLDLGPSVSPALLLGDGAGNVHVHASIGGSWTNFGAVPFGSGDVIGLTFGPLSTVFAGVDGEYRLYVLDILGLTPAWTAPSFGTGMGARTALYLPIGLHATTSSIGVIGFRWL